MFLRQNKRKKNGKTHRYFTVVENRRASVGGTTQRQVLYLGGINDTQQQAWRRTLEVFDEDQGQYRELSLFPDVRSHEHLLRRALRGDSQGSDSSGTVSATIAVTAGRLSSPW